MHHCLQALLEALQILESKKILRRDLLSAGIYQRAISHGMQLAGSCQKDNNNSEQGRFCIF